CVHPGFGGRTMSQRISRARIGRVRISRVRAPVAAQVAVMALLLAAAPRAAALTPAEGHTYFNQVGVDAPCDAVDKAQDTRWRGWSVFTADPERKAGEGQTILPAQLPRVEVMGDWVTNQFSKAPFPEAIYTADPEQPGPGCYEWRYNNDTALSGGSVTLARPGPYVFMKLTQTSHFEQVPDDEPEPTPTKCAENDNTYYPNPVGSGPEVATTGHKWVVTSFCNKTDVIHFNVEGDTGICPTSAQP